jgi:hypothetical protein
MIKPEVVLEISIKALEVYGIEPNIIRGMLNNLQRIMTDSNTITKEKIIEIMKYDSENIEGQDGRKGMVLWEDYFEDIADEIINFNTK